MSPYTSAFFKANASDSPFCADVDMHIPMFDIFFYAGVVDSSESKHSVMGRFHWVTTVLRAPTRIVRALTAIKCLQCSNDLIKTLLTISQQARY